MFGEIGKKFQLIKFFKVQMMLKKGVLEQYLDSLLKGNRKASQAIIEETLQTGMPANLVYITIIWPIMVEIQELLREDRITTVQEHLATRINRAIVDQLQNKLPRKPGRDKKIVICCAPSELQEVGAQMFADLFESDGWEVKLLGGGLNNDDILAFTHEYGPDILLIYGITSKQAPGIRQLIDTIRDINACSDMRIMVSGGLFSRAEGLWQEIGADLFAATAEDAVRMACQDSPAEPEPETRNRGKKRRKVSSNIPAEVT